MRTTRQNKILVGIVVGSDSDLPVIHNTAKRLESFGINYHLTIASAHRSPARVKQWIQNMEKKGVEVFIAGAGGAAHLPGVVAAETILPVIGVPMPTIYLNGQDSLYSIVQMPSGMPVATMAIGKAGAINAAILAAQILGRKYEPIANNLKKFKQELVQGVERKANKLDKVGADDYLETM